MLVEAPFDVELVELPPLAGASVLAAPELDEVDVDALVPLALLVALDPLAPPAGLDEVGFAVPPLAVDAAGAALLPAVTTLTDAPLAAERQA